MREWVLGVHDARYQPISLLISISQEVVGSSARDMRLTATRRWVKHQEIVIHLFVDFHYSSFVTASIAVVWRWKDRHNLLLMTPIIASHDKLMGTSHCLQPILLYKLVWYVLSECVAGSARRDSPACTIVRIWPQKVAHRPFMGYFHNTVNISDHV